MTIPATNSQLLVTEDWTKIYQSFRNADFQSYDFDTIRRILISYLQENYPEDFNDFIDSSEYIALVDLIAYMGQNLSFRIDLNARENFLETAQRRDSILRLAQLVGYVPKRNIPASGLLKITSVSTTENVIDATGVNLANVSVAWNDPSNTNWYQQFIAVVNAAMPGSTAFGVPNDRNENLNGIYTEQYLINSSNVDVPAYSFSQNINGTYMNFEIVPATFSGKDFIYESAPAPRTAVSLIYQNDNQGSGSANTGFFAFFKQGALALSNFTINNPVPDEIIGINVSGINNTDVWLWQLNADGTYPSAPWTQVPNVIGNNVIYNSLKQNVRNVYSVTNRDTDQIDLNFADGSFGNLPKGQFVLYYRQSNGLVYSITPQQMSGISVDIPYINKAGQPNKLTLTLGLQYTVNNSAATETNASIQQNAPQNYYLQNRMVTAEDYNIAPLTVTSNVLKVKSVARVSSGVSKYFELSDVSGKYSSTNIFADDGVLYKNISQNSFEFSFISNNQIFTAIKKHLEPIIASRSLLSFYLDQYRKSSYAITASGYTWNLTNAVAGQSRGYFKAGTTPQPVGSSAYAPLSYITAGSMIKFVPPAGSYFLPNGKITSIQSSKTVSYMWTTVLQVIGDGANNGLGNLNDGTGPVIFSNNIGNGAVPTEIIPAFISSFSYSFESDIVNLCLTQTNFGLSFDVVNRTWNVILDTNLNLADSFSLTNQNDDTNTNKDSSWLVAFTWTGISYKVLYRTCNYIFESIKQTGFMVDSASVNFDYTNNSVVKDQIDVLSVNAAPNTSSALGVDYKWQIDDSIVESDGYVDPSKVLVSFYTYEGSGTVSEMTNPDTFNNIVGSINTGTSDSYVMFELGSDGLTYNLLDSSLYIVYNTEQDALNAGLDSDYLYYIVNDGAVKNVSANGLQLVYNPNYLCYAGRSGLKFQYQHNTGQDYRIDPSKSNIIDVYMLTTAYDTAFRNWLSTGNGTQPLPPTSQSLASNYSSDLEPIKTISDEIIYQPVTYKVLFGSSAPASLQGTFKAVQSASSTKSQNEIIASILSAINQFFALENWDFGQSFYFSELSAYVMNLLTPDITNFVIVPTVNNFGSLYEVACQSNEIFISGATAADIKVISAITASQLNTTSIITNANNS